jgi:hypothetical protein
VDQPRPAESGRILRVVAPIDRHQAEALRLELIRLARRYGLEPGRGRVEAGRHENPDEAAERTDA